MSIYLSLNYYRFYWITGGLCKAYDTEAINHTPFYVEQIKLHKLCVCGGGGGVGCMFISLTW